MCDGKEGVVRYFQFRSWRYCVLLSSTEIREECLFMSRSKSEVKRQDPKMNLAFYDEHLAFCRAMARKKHLSVTQYVNGLIAEEMRKHEQIEWCVEDAEASSAN